MFSELVECSAAKHATRKPYAIAFCATLQTVCLLVVILLPLIYTEALPTTVLTAVLVAPATRVIPRSTPVLVIRRRIAAFRSGVIQEPARIAHGIMIYREPEAPLDSLLNAGADQNQSALNLLNGDLANAPIVPPAPPPAATVPRIKQGGGVIAARAISQSRPEYPALARMAHIQGDVVLHAIIDKDGAVIELQVLSGHPLLVKAALDAVRTWRYQPTLLSGEPVEVDTTITVSFVLAR